MPSITSLHIAPASGGYEPYRSYDWTLDIIIPGRGSLDPLTLSVAVAFWPQLEFEVIQIPYGNDSVYVPGKATVQQGQATYNDYVGVETEQILTSWWLRHYNPATGMQYPVTNFKTTGTIRKSAPGMPANSGSGWELRGLWMASFVTGEAADYGTSDVKKCQVTFQFDRAVPVAAGGTGSIDIPDGPGRIGFNQNGGGGFSEGGAP